MIWLPATGEKYHSYILYNPPTFRISEGERATQAEVKLRENYFLHFAQKQFHHKSVIVIALHTAVHLFHEIIGEVKSQPGT